MVALNQLDDLAAVAADAATAVAVPVDNTKLKSADAIVLKSGDSLGSEVATAAVALASEPVVEYTTALQDVTYNDIAGTVVRIYGLDTTKVVTVDGVTAKYYQQRDTSGELTGKTVHIACVAKTAEPVITVANGTPAEISIGDINSDKKINVTDITVLSKSIATLSETNPRTGVTTNYSLPSDLNDSLIFDINGDGKINVTDITVLSKSIATLSETNPRTGVTTNYSLNSLTPLTK